MGIARAGQIAERREYPNDIRDNEQRKAGISCDGNRKSKTEGDEAMRRGGDEAGNRRERGNRRAHVRRVARLS